MDNRALSLEDMLRKIVREEIQNALNPSKVLTMKDIARRYSCSYTHLVNHPYLLPNNGKSEFGGVKRWLTDDVEKWEQIPVDERKASYERGLIEKSRQVLATRGAV